MGVGDIHDVDEISNACSIARRIIRSEDLDVVAYAQRDIKDQRHQMRFGLVPFTHAPLGVRPYGVEIAEGNIFEPISDAVVLQDLLNVELAARIWGDRKLWAILLERHRAVIGIHSARR